MRTMEVTLPIRVPWHALNLTGKKSKCNTACSPDEDTGAPGGLCPKPSLGCLLLPLGPSPYPSRLHDSVRPSTGLRWGRGGCIRKLILSGLTGARPALLYPEAPGQSENRTCQKPGSSGSQRGSGTLLGGGRGNCVVPFRSREQMEICSPRRASSLDLKGCRDSTHI